MKKIAILGSTGSIGTQALDIIEKNPDKYKVTVLSCGKRTELLSEQINRFKPEVAVVAEESQAAELSKKHPDTEIIYGDAGLKKAASLCDHEMVLNALVGIRGLAPTYAAIEAGKNIALANKETLVTGGEVIMSAVRKNGVKMLPVDSEHSAIFQCLHAGMRKDVSRILLTASGGPFRGKSLKELENVSLEQALNHPNWDMGSKITIDSATMMNKGFEVIEARWLFDIDIDSIQVLVHPQSIVHSALEFCDGSVIAQMGVPDMKVPIGLAFSYPDRLADLSEKLDMFSDGANLTFEKPDYDTFRCLSLAFEASKKGGTYPVVLNGANEVLVERFLKKEISFLDIQNTLEDVLNKHNPVYEPTLEQILEADRVVRASI